MDFSDAMVDSMTSFYDSLNPEKQKLKAYQLGLEVGYRKESDKEQDVPSDYTSQYTDGLMVGLSIETDNEYQIEIDKIEAKIESVSLDRRRSLKSLSFGLAYGMGTGRFSSAASPALVNYAKNDMIDYLRLEEIFNSGKEDKD